MKTQIAKDVLKVVRENNKLSSFLQSLQTSKATTKQSILYDERPVDRSKCKRSGDQILKDWLDQLKGGLLNGEIPGLDSSSIFVQRVWELEESQLKKYGPQGGHPPMSEVWAEIYGESFTPMPRALYEQYRVEYLKEYAKRDRGYAKVSPENDRFLRELPALADSVAKWLSLMDAPQILMASGLDVEDSSLFLLAMIMTVEDLRKNRVWNLHAANPPSVVSDLLAEGKLSTNSGYPLFGTRKDPSVIAGSLNAIASGEYVWYPAIPLFRYYNGKLRGVWMYPFAVNIVEATVVRPFMRAVQKSKLVENGFFAPWKGFDAVKRLISKKYEDSKSYIAATDYSSTDKHFNLSYSVICAWVMAATFKSEDRAKVFANVLRMHTIPLVISDEEMLVGPHGVASGSEETNLIETIGGAIQGNYEKLLSQEKAAGLYGIGDDMSHTVDASMSPDEFIKFVSDVGADINQEIKEEKVTADFDYVKSLQRLMQRGYYVPGENSVVRAVYPTVRALKSIVYPERYHKKATDEEGNSDPYDKYDFCSRVYQILENTCDHPMFYQFVAYVISGSVDLVKFAMMDNSKVDHYYERSKRLSGLTDTYNIEYADRQMSQFLSIQAARLIIRTWGDKHLEKAAGIKRKRIPLENMSSEYAEWKKLNDPTR